MEICFKKIQKCAIPMFNTHILMYMHGRISGHTGTLHHMEGKIRFWAILHQSNVLLCSSKELSQFRGSEQRTPKPATARDLALSPWQSVDNGTLSWSLLQALVVTVQRIPSLCEDQGALTASAVSIF